MRFSRGIRCRCLPLAAALLLPSATGLSQEKHPPAVTIDLRPLGAAADLFTDQSDSKYQQRAVINLFWLGNDRIAVAFSTTRRWSGTEKPDPLHVRLVVFDNNGKQLNERGWSFGAEGPDGEVRLGFAAGPDNSILAIHDSTDSSNGGKIPEGNFVQVLNLDTTRREDFYVPSTSVYLTAISPEPELVLQTFYADKHSSLAWWSGHPLKPGVKLDLPRGGQETIVGPEAAARALCGHPQSSPLDSILGEQKAICAGIHVFRPGAPTRMYGNPDYRNLIPAPRAFLSSADLLIEMRKADQKPGELFVIHQDGTQTQLAAFPKGVQIIAVSSIARDGKRFTIDAGGEAGLCGGLSLWCKQRGQTLVFDIPTNRIIFQQEISANGGLSAISPDGKQLAIFDRDKLALYRLQ